MKLKNLFFPCLLKCILIQTDKEASNEAVEEPAKEAAEEAAEEAAKKAAEEAAEEETTVTAEEASNQVPGDFSRHFKMFQDEKILENTKTFREIFKYKTKFNTSQKKI